jgi:hypothetical protein
MGGYSWFSIQYDDIVNKIGCNYPKKLEQMKMQNVEIRVRGILDPKWSEWLDNLDILHEDQDQTLLIGQVVDQATLYGILKKLRDLGLKLLLVRITDV